MAPSSISDLLARTREAFTNAADDPDLQAALAPYGYDPIKVAEGQALHDALAAAQAAQQQEYGEQYGATDAAEAAFEAAQAVYMRHLALARVVFAGDTGRAGSLGLSGDRAQNRAGRIAQAKTFYTNALGDADAVTAMAGVNADLTALQAGQAAIAAADAATAAQQRETGEAQQSTVARDAAAEALQAWFSRFVQIAKLATDGQPQLRERLGIMERS